ncbi:MAG: DUF3943 domain-containing protein [Gammaproteobacteria bacterium]|nr:DUF3943 domain-containing protein [Gammaproteobacteria bacterium]
MMSVIKHPPLKHLLSIALCITLLLPLSAWAADPALDSPPAPVKPKKNYLYPLAEVFLINGLIFSWNRYAVEAKWSYVDYDTINSNLVNGFGWDNDQFNYNQLYHPYQGGQYHSAARYYGLNYWESMSYTALGSLHWEYMMENESPAINDFITTTLSGSIFGEAIFRMARLILDQSPESKKVLRELGIAMINPTVGFNRLVAKDSFATRSDIASTYFAGDIALGISNENVVDKHAVHYNFRWRTHYGDPFSTSRKNLPFDFFNFDLLIKRSEPAFAINGTISGLLYKKPLKLFAKDKVFFGIFQNFDYYSNALLELDELERSSTPIVDTERYEQLQDAAYKIGTTSIGAGLFFHNRFPGRVSLMTFLQMVAIPLGGANSTYAKEAGRTYNMGVGWGGKLYSRLFVGNYLQLFLSNHVFHIKSLSGGDGLEIVSITNAGAFIPLAYRLHLGIEWTSYLRYGHYDNLPDIRGNHRATQAFLSYNF